MPMPSSAVYLHLFAPFRLARQTLRKRIIDTSIPLRHGVGQKVHGRRPGDHATAEGHAAGMAP